MSAPAVEDVVKQLEALMHDLKRVQDNLLLNEGRLSEARSGLAGLDDGNARRAIASAGRAHADLCNAHYGSLHDFLVQAEHFIVAFRG